MSLCPIFREPRHATNVFHHVEFAGPQCTRDLVKACAIPSLNCQSSCLHPDSYPVHSGLEPQPSPERLHVLLHSATFHGRQRRMQPHFGLKA